LDYERYTITGTRKWGDFGNYDLTYVKKEVFGFNASGLA
jgi:hypothetical protein